MTDDEIISIAVKTSLLNYIDNETPRHFFVSGHAELDDVVNFGRIIEATALQEAARAILVGYNAAVTNIAADIRALKGGGQ